VASQALYDWASQLWDTVAAALPRNPQSAPASLNDQILEVLTTYTTASYTSAAVVLLSLIFLSYRYLMGDRSGWSYYPGRGSPFSSSLADNGPRNLSGHFEYIGDDHDLYNPRSPARASYSAGDGYPDLDDNDPNAPDRVHCRYMASSFPLDFAAYSINEEKTLVEDLRRKVADRLGVDPRKVRLIYKGHDLKHNLAPLKRYKMKQNSEVSVVITERAVDYYTPDQNSDSGSDRDSGNYLTANPRRQQRPRAHSTIRLRSDEKIPVMEPNGGGAYLSPNGHIPSVSAGRPHRDSLHPDPDYGRDRDDRHRERGREREPSRGPAPRRREPSREPSRGPPREAPRRAVSPAPPPKPAAPPADPNSPLGRVQALASTFYTQWLPPATKFLASPPSDSAAREKEFLKLSESIMAKVVLAADTIETEGNLDARNERKSLINEANKVLKELDSARHG
jgi:hypothetical protein